MPKRDADLDGLYHEVADRFAALSKLFSHLGSPEAIQSLIKALTTRDGAAFKDLVDLVDIPVIPMIPVLGKCLWVHEIIEKIACGMPYLVYDYRLREPLTHAERETYIQIVARHRGTPTLVAETTSPPDDPTAIPPGPFLDDLKANGLVTPTERLTRDCRLKAVWGPPKEICF